MSSQEKKQEDSLRLRAMEWFFSKGEIEKIELKEKHFKNEYIQFSDKWGFHFTLGQIEQMYKKETQDGKE